MIAEIIPKIAEMKAEKEHKFYPRPSSAGSEKCIRQMVYHGLNQPKKPLPGRALLVFDDSSWHEELTADWVRKSSFQLHSEQMEVTCRPPMTKGHIDGIITDMLGVDRLWEHKAINHFTVQRFWNSEYPLDYLTQCAVYIEGLQRDNPDLTDGVLNIKNKNTAQYMDFEFHYDRATDTLTVFKKTHSTGEILNVDFKMENVVQGACDKFTLTLDYIKRKTLPKRQYDLDHWRCQYCSYCVTCWEGYEQEFNELKTGAMLPNEIADMVRYYRELGGQQKDIKAEYDDLRKKVKKMMEEAGAREGRAGEYLLKMKLEKRSRIDKEMLTDKELEKALQYYHIERLYISKPKEAA